MTQVLIAEDDEVSRGMLEQALLQAGFEVTAVGNGAEALAELRSGNQRLVVTDWDMPGMTGIELCQAIRRGEFAGYVYIILVTSHDSPQETVDGLTAGRRRFREKALRSERTRAASAFWGTVAELGNARGGDFRDGEIGRVAQSGNRRPFGACAKLLSFASPADGGQSKVRRRD